MSSLRCSIARVGRQMATDATSLLGSCIEIMHFPYLCIPKMPFYGPQAPKLLRLGSNPPFLCQVTDKCFAQAAATITLPKRRSLLTIGPPDDIVCGQFWYEAVDLARLLSRSLRKAQGSRSKVSLVFERGCRIEDRHQCLSLLSRLSSVVDLRSC